MMLGFAMKSDQKQTVSGLIFAVDPEGSASWVFLIKSRVSDNMVDHSRLSRPTQCVRHARRFPPGKERQRDLAEKKVYVVISFVAKRNVDSHTEELKKPWRRQRLYA